MKTTSAWHVRGDGARVATLATLYTRMLQFRVILPPKHLNFIPQLPAKSAPNMPSAQKAAIFGTPLQWLCLTRVVQQSLHKSLANF